MTQALKEKGARDSRRRMEAALAERTVELQAAIESLRASEDRYRDLVENSQDLICTHDLDGKLLSVNAGAVRLTGYAQEALLRMNMADLLTRGTRDGFAAYLDEIRTTGVAHGFMRIRTADGKTRWWEYHNTLRTQGVAVPVVRGMAQDITERKQAEAALAGRSAELEAALQDARENAARYRVLTETAMDAIITIDERQNIVLFNAAAERMFGYSAAEAIGQPLDRLLPGSSRAAHREHVRGFQGGAGAMARSAAIFGLRADGTQFPTEVSIAQVKIAQGTFYTAILRDVTERKLQEQKITRLSRIHAVLSSINSLIVRVRDRQELFDKACRIAVEQGGFGVAWIGVLNQETLEVTPSAWAGVDVDSFVARGQNTAQPDTALSQNMANRAIREKRAVFSNDLAMEPDAGGERRKEAIRRGYRSAIALPLLMDSTAVGNLSLFTKDANFFTVDEVKLLTELAGDIAFAFDHIFKQEKLDKLSRIRAVSSGINAAIVRIREREELLKETCRIAVEHGKFELVWIATLDMEQQEARPVAWAGFSPAAARSVSLATIKTIGGAVDEAIRMRWPVINNNIDAGTEKGLLRREAIGKGCFSAVCIPLVVEEKVVAICVLYALGRDFFDPDEIAIVNELAGDISHALQAIARQEKLNKLSRMRTVSGEINAAIVRIREREPLLKDVCRIAVEHGKFELVWIALVDQKMQKIQSMAWAGFSPEIVHALNWDGANASQTMLAEVMLTRKIAVRNDIEAEGPVGMLREVALKRGCHSAVCLPLLLDDAVVTVIILYATGTHFFDQDELALLSEVAANLSFALQSMARQEKLNYLAYYDALTGLPNRALFDDRMTQVLRAASHENSKTALVLIDLERFRIYNDTLGRGATDDLLKQVAQRLQGVIFDRDSLARVHADVFAGLFPDIKDEADIAHLVEEKIFGCLSQPFTIARQELRVSAKIGVALFPGDAMKPDALFSSAEAALKQAKDSSDRYLFYARKMNAQVAERLQLESKLLRALEQKQFVLFYQPKVDLGSGRIAGLEALLRWNDPETGLVMPMLFIPLLEETGMIVEVGAWAMKQAVSQYAAWQAAGLQPPPIAVNVSAVQLKRRDFVASVEQAIAIAGKPDHGLDIEITESMIMEDIEACIEKLKLIRDLGVGIFIDDFGTGHSSLRYLTRLPITALKIDRAFIRHMATNADDVAIVSTVITLGHNLKLKVIAEGVETEEQSKFLRLLRCDEYQGYLFSKPVPAEQVPALLVKP